MWVVCAAGGTLASAGGFKMEQQNIEQKTMLEQISNNLGYFYKNGWDELFENGTVIQDAVLCGVWTREPPIPARFNSPHAAIA